MRTHRFLLTAALTIALLATPLAAADDDEEDDRENDRDRRGHERRAAVHADNDRWQENHTAMMERFLAHLHTMHASWKENATKTRADCRAELAYDAPNATKDERKDFRHCVRDGYREWRADHREKLQKLREEFRELFGGFPGARHGSD